MSTLVKYPNPQRLFVSQRDNWFFKLLDEYNIPVNVFISIRNSQLGQLILLIQSNRSKMIRKGEDPGPDIFDKNTVSQLIPVYQLISQFNKFLESNLENFQLDKFIDKLNIVNLNKLINKVYLQSNEWGDITLSSKRINEIYINSYDIFKELIISCLKDHYEIESYEEILDKIKLDDENLSKVFHELFDPVIYDSLINDTWKINEENHDVRIIINKEEKLNISEAQIQEKSLSMYSFVIELIRFFENKSIDVDFPLLTPLLTIEMLTKIPYPDKSLIPLVREYNAELKKRSDLPEFYELLFQFYQIYSYGINPQNPKILSRRFSNTLSTFKQNSKIFWNKISKNNLEEYIPVIWSGFSISIVQLKNKIDQRNNVTEYDRYCYTLLNKLNQVFWNQSISFFKNSKFDSAISFWGYNVYLSNKSLKSAKQALDLFIKFDELISSLDIFNDDKMRDLLDINLLDQYSLLQRILSFGFESRSKDIFKKLKNYNNLLLNVLNEIKDGDNMYNLNIKDELKAVDEINKFIENPNFPQAQPSTNKRLKNKF